MVVFSLFLTSSSPTLMGKLIFLFLIGLAEWFGLKGKIFGESSIIFIALCTVSFSLSFALSTFLRIISSFWHLSLLPSC